MPFPAFTTSNPKVQEGKVGIFLLKIINCEIGKYNVLLSFLKKLKILTIITNKYAISNFYNIKFQSSRIKDMFYY